MPGYTIVTSMYYGAKPANFAERSSDGITETTVYYTVRPDIDSATQTNAAMPFRLAANDTVRRVVGVCVGGHSPWWLTAAVNHTTCYIRRHIYTGHYGTTYNIRPTLYRTEEEARSVVDPPCPLKGEHVCHVDVTKAFLANNDLIPTPYAAEWNSCLVMVT